MDDSFYSRLYSDDSFNCALGRLVLASARFESSLRDYAEKRGVRAREPATLGRLVKALKDTDCIDRTAMEHFQVLVHERNYFVHKLHHYLSEYPKDQFELHGFINRASASAQEMNFFSKLVEDL